MKTAFIFTLLVLEFSFPLLAQQGAENVTVEVQGLGKDAQSAEKNALYQAVERAVGAYLDNETVVKNEEVIHDKLLTVAQGFVQKYDVLVPAKESKDGSNIWEIKIRAVVRKSDVGAALRAAGVMQVAADGIAAWATQITRLKSREDAMALLEKVIPEIPRNVVVCSLEQPGDKLQIQEDPKTGNQQVVVKVRMEINYDWWMKEAVPALDASLRQLKLGQSEVRGYHIPLESAGRVIGDATANIVYSLNGYNELAPVTSFTWVTSETLDVQEFSSYWRIPKKEGNEVHLLTQTGSISRFKAYELPTDWWDKVNKLWNRGQNGGELNYGGIPFIAVVIGLESDPEKSLFEVPLYVDGGVLNTLGAGYPFENFAPVLREGTPILGSQIMMSITYTVKFDVSADILKQTKRLVLKAARFGIKRPASSSSGTQYNR